MNSPNRDSVLKWQATFGWKWVGRQQHREEDSLSIGVHTDTHGVLRVADPRTAQGRGTVQQPVLYSWLGGGGGGGERGCVRKYPVMREGDLNLNEKSLVRNYGTRNIDIFEMYFNYFHIDQKFYTEQ